VNAVYLYLRETGRIFIKLSKFDSENENAFNATAYITNEITICAIWVTAGEFHTTDNSGA
jgi:hypothetical protein